MNTKQIIALAGGQTSVARHFDIEPPSVQDWITLDKIPPMRILGVSALTGWRVTPHMINPTLYPNPQDGLPSDSEGGAYD